MGKLYKGAVKLGKLADKGVRKIPLKYRRTAVAAALLWAWIDFSPKPPEQLLKDKGYSIDRVCQQHYAPVGKLEGEEIVEMAQRYVGDPYGKNKRFCSPIRAEKRNCWLQCAAYVSSVFKYAAKEKGVHIPIPSGNGINKCTNSYHVRKNMFDDPELLKPGDIFSSTGNLRFGHAGIYVGKGLVSKKKGNVYLKFKPDDKGKHVFIHSTTPVIGYNILEDLEKHRDIVSFCRHESLCHEDDGVCEE